ncbi:zf-HC2 domain-containing protein [Streptomyces tropicalis]|uniref:Zf-HC2 domain-containing protein n=1 Tax=Streptomyces tropicalis TaxID=3034234 RepID=A0ABT6A073_9ACTN|nr:zf-HC2 domain-containing protein [Streptomyces tropicalis]MDF3298043.1 zf-HC2 domain-containing protein [Streptomyces tropicalis]
MSGSRVNAAARQLAEQHLGDRLSALVDGELGHDTRERVLAHVATCAKCRSEVDAQRRLKNVFAEAAPPPPSASLLARLQGLPGGGDGLPGGSPLDAGALSGRDGVFGVQRDEPFALRYVPAVPHTPRTGHDRGFRIHPVGRPDAERGSSRGLRFAFAAAGAVSLAAVALGGVTTGLPGDVAAEARSGSGAGSNATPARTAGGPAASAPGSQRRRSSGSPVAPRGQRTPGTPVVPTTLSAPLLPGVPPDTGRTLDALPALTAPVVAGAAVMSPLIRPLTANPPITLTGWTRDPEFRTPGLLAAPLSGQVSAPSSSASPHRVP